jgi:hypothetical protein
MNSATKTRIFVAFLAIFVVAFTSLILLNAHANSGDNSIELQVTSVVLRDEYGNVITSVKRGHFVFAEVTVQNPQSYYSAYYYYYYYYYTYTSQPFLLVARLDYGYPTTMEGIGAFKGSLAGGQSITAAPGFQIPANGPTGTYTVTILVFSNWPSAGGYPLIATPVTTTITVNP